MADEERALAWARVPWATSVFHLPGVPLEVAARLHAADLKTIGDLDRLVLDCREAELGAMAQLKRNEVSRVLAALLAWSKAQFKKRMEERSQ